MRDERENIISAGVIIIMILCAVPAAARRAQRGGEGEKT
jgi:hypothetical protein